MNYDPNEISKKSDLVTTVLCLCYGGLGIHRFYVGKWKSGLLFLVLGSASLTQRILSFFHVGIFNSVFYSILFCVAIAIGILFDLFALYSESFTDSKGKLVVSARLKEEMGLLSPEQRFNERLTAISIFLLLIVLIIFTEVVIPTIADYIQ